MANQVPTILLGQKQVKQESGESVVPEEEKAMVTDLENKEINEMEPEKEEVEEVETQEPEDNLEKLGSNQAVFVSLANRLANALNKDAIDQIAVEFAFINNKGTRKQLAQTLLGVSRQRLDLLPYYSRLIATLNPYMPDIGTMVVEEVFLKVT